MALALLQVCHHHLLSNACLIQLQRVTCKVCGIMLLVTCVALCHSRHVWHCVTCDMRGIMSLVTCVALCYLWHAWHDMWHDMWQLMCSFATDIKGLENPEVIQDYQKQLLKDLMAYTTSAYPEIPLKFGELLIRLSEVQRSVTHAACLLTAAYAGSKKLLTCKSLAPNVVVDHVSSLTLGENWANLSNIAVECQMSNIVTEYL